MCYLCFFSLARDVGDEYGASEVPAPAMWAKEPTFVQNAQKWRNRNLDGDIWFYKKVSICQFTKSKLERHAQKIEDLTVHPNAS